MADFEEPVTRGVPYSGFWPHGNGSATQDAQSLMPVVGNVVKDYMYQPGTRESDNVEDRRFDDEKLYKHEAYMAYQGPGRFAQPELASTLQTRGSPAPGDPSEAQRRPFLRPTTYDRNPFLPIGSYRGDKTVSWAVPGMVQDIWDSMKALKGGIPIDEETGHVAFDPKDTMNVAGAAMTGAMGRLATVESAGLGVGGGRALPPKKTFEVPLKSTKGEDFVIRRDASDPRQWTFVKDGETVGEFAFIRDPANPSFYNVDGINVFKPGLGLGEPTYKHFMKLAEQLGDKVVPSDNLTQATRNIWEKLEPGVISKGAYKLTDTEEGPRYFRSDATFSTKAQEQGGRIKTDPAQFPTQGVLPAIDGPMIHKINQEYKSRAMNGMDMTAPYSGLDPSVLYSTQHMDKRVFAKATNLLVDKAEKQIATLKKEMPDLSFEIEKSGTSAYVHVKDGDNQILKFRYGDHGATGMDVLSIDPVSGNTLETILQVLKYERGLSDVPPQIGWSYLPPEKFRTAMNKQAGLNIFPRSRQIGGTAEYRKGGYQSEQRPYQIKEQTVGTDIQWRDPELRKPLNEAAE